MPERRRTRIKFCGLTRAEDVAEACMLGVDAVGFVFAARSKRLVSSTTAADLRDADEAGFDTLLDILDEAAVDWQARDVPFWAFLALPDADFPEQADAAAR